MKKHLLSSLFMFACAAMFAQTVTLTFTAMDAGNHYVQLNRVAITNLTKSWQETIFWPDTVLSMQNGTGVEDYTENGGFALSQNTPNPFSGTTDVNLTVSEEGSVIMEIADANGRVVETQNFASLRQGIHQFRVFLSTAGTYIMTARQNGQTSSIKMICNGGGGSNAIGYLGVAQVITYVLKSTTNNPFNFGDIMEYVGYATINDTEAESQRITQAQGTSQLFVLQFPVVQHQAPSVTTTAANNVTETSATCGGNVTSDGGANVIVRGVCFGTSQNPTTADSHTTDGSGTGSFTSSITGLLANTTYYVRAYATNSVGTTYGNEVSFTTTASAQLPSVTTTAANNVTETSATCGGNVISDGGATVTARGVCWSTSQSPTVNDSHTTDGNGTGSFTSNLTGLTAGTTYYVRAYATNSAGTAYGNEVNFTTITSGTTQDGQPCPGMPTLTDIDGNIYNTVQLGNQCWMADNLRTTRYADNTIISQGSSASTTEAYWYYPNNDASNMPTYGLLYNWKAVMHNASSSSANPSGVQGICPTGWHVPSDTEWVQLTTYVSSQSQYICGNDNTQIAKALASTTGWNSSSGICDVGNTPSNNNATNFNAPPAGVRTYSFFDMGRSVNFWKSTEYNSNNAYSIGIALNVANIVNSNNPKTYGFSVRCVRDESGSTTTQMPTVTTSAASNITANSATCGGNVTSNGGATVTARGVCWSTSQSPTVNDSHTTDGNGTGSFTSNLTGLTAGTTYYVRAYATNSAGTAYGNEVGFTTIASGTTQDWQPCPSSTTLTDIDGNVYNTVQIGNQCWMKENLKTTKYADGTSISQGSSTSSYDTPYWYYPNNSSSNKPTYGLLYNWKALMRNSSSSASNPSGVQGICPTGWHVPSYAEWTQLSDYVSSQSQWVCGSSNSYIAKALAGTIGWDSSTNTCAVGNTPSNNNATGFSALPAGNNIDYFGYCAYFWSATQNDSSDAYNRYLYYSSANVSSYGYYKSAGYSVRCVRNEGGSSTAQLPTVTTSAASNITANSATCGGYITSDGGSTVTSCGVCWSTSQNPTVSDSHTSDGSGIGGSSGTGIFISNLTGLTANTTYYVRAYATNSAGTTYGNEVSFTTLSSGGTSQDGQPCPGTATLTDYDGNVYNTVQIGNQCWMKENLRTTHYSNGTTIALGSDTSTITAYRYYPPNNTFATYSYLYNWPAVMGGSSSSNANPSGVQGICPIGWHVPSDAEWTQLTDYVSSQSQYVCGNDSTYIAKALASTTNWPNTYNTQAYHYCTVFCNISHNNATGFSALPAGVWVNGNNNGFWYYAMFWSSSLDENEPPYIHGMCLTYDYATVGLGQFEKENGVSVRCLKN